MQRKETPVKKAGRLVSLCMKPYKWKFIFPIMFTFIGSVLGNFNPFIIGLAITELGENIKEIAQNVPGAQINYRYILIISIVLAVSSVFRQALTYLASYIAAEGVQCSFRDLRSRISHKMNTLPVAYFDSRQHGNILSTITNDVDAVTNAVQQSLLPMVYSLTSVLTTFIMMIYISPRLGIACLVLIPAIFLTSRAIMKRSQQYFSKMQNSLADMNGFVQEHYNAFTVVKLYNDENNAVNQFREITSRLNKAGMKANFASSLLSPLMELLISSVYILMTFLTGYAVLFSGMSLGNMQAFVQYIWIVYDPMGQIMQLAPAAQSAMASMERIVNFLEEEEERAETGKAAVLNPADYAGAVRFKHVQFSYTKEVPLIQDFTLEAKPGQKIAIVGATGAGKSTIINLLMRFYDIDAGDICIDGESIYHMNRNAERTLFGMVLQDAWLYHATIKENIRFGRLDATDEEVIQAAKRANVHHFIQTMPGGYNMMIHEDGSNISLGQKQLLTIARAILAEPRILILDEATSSVDTRLEMLIQVAMKSAMHNRTSFVIAHRLSTIKDADLILVMESGNVAEQGTHAELLARKGIYQRLYNSQFEEA